MLILRSFACSMCLTVLGGGRSTMNFYRASFTGLPKRQTAQVHVLRNSRSGNTTHTPNTIRANCMGCCDDDPP